MGGGGVGEFATLEFAMTLKLGNIAMSMLLVVKYFSCALMSSLGCWAMFRRYVFHSEVISEETKAGLTLSSASTDLAVRSFP